MMTVSQAVASQRYQCAFCGKRIERGSVYVFSEPEGVKREHLKCTKYNKLFLNWRKGASQAKVKK